MTTGFRKSYVMFGAAKGGCSTSVSYHLLLPFHSPSCWVVKREHRSGVPVSLLGISVLQFERLSKILLALVMLNLDEPPQLSLLYFHCPSSSATPDP